MYIYKIILRKIEKSLQVCICAIFVFLLCDKVYKLNEADFRHVKHKSVLVFIYVERFHSCYQLHPRTMQGNVQMRLCQNMKTRLYKMHIFTNKNFCFSF